MIAVLRLLLTILAKPLRPARNSSEAEPPKQLHLGFLPLDLSHSVWMQRGVVDESTSGTSGNHSYIG